MPESTTPTLPTNTLIITNLEVPHFEKETMLNLKAMAESFGNVFYFAPIKSFYRVFVVYKATADAQKAKAELHNTTFEGSTIRHTETVIDPASRYLHPPELEKNWLISPPGSPPVGWSQVREDPPNSLHLADDLVKALLEMGQPVYQLPRPDGSFADRSHLFEAEVEDFSLDDPHHDDISEEKGGASTGVAGTGLKGTNDDAASTKSNSSGASQLHQQILGLKIDTRSSSSARSASPNSTHSPASSLFPPATPTVLAFSPAKEAEGDQPFITVQDWGIQADTVAPSPLRRRGSIPKTAFPTGPHQKH
ncbi:carbohydrate-binding module 1 protein [Linnemannia exigua]|uniref:Carbohydrate-binding module 1 protein n=1 Tax=Linnemannia exigua TaxID=604196 RepID=A0AAD4DB42_9FUNG|nr:carbohydrate-binding module 1 protein [Linnemannia exigua]